MTPDSQKTDSERFPFTTPEGSDASMFIQWKGTDVCLDFHCPCQPESNAYAFHFDGYFADVVRCPACGAAYRLGTQVIAKRISADDEWADRAVLLDADEDTVYRPAATGDEGGAV